MSWIVKLCTLAVLIGGAAIGLLAIWSPMPVPEDLVTQAADSLDQRSIRLTDMAGRQVEIPQPVQRIVLLRSYGFYDLVAVLGDEIEDKLVGWDSSLKKGDRDAYDRFLDRFPALSQTVVLGDVLRDSVSAEAVLALKPDLVILNAYMLERHLQSVRRLEQAGIPLLTLDFSDPFHDPQKSLLLLGRALGQESRAADLVDWINQELQKVFPRLEQITGLQPSLYLEAGTQGPAEYGNTFGQNEQHQTVNWGSVAAQLRCRNVAADVIAGRYGMGVIRPEYLLTADPDVIVITGANWTAFPESLRLGYEGNENQARSVLRAFTERPGWRTLSAVQHGRVHGIHTRFGSHVMSFAAAQQLAKWLYPAEFRDLDPEANLREFHERFMPVKFQGTWMVSLEHEE